MRVQNVQTNSATIPQLTHTHQ